MRVKRRIEKLEEHSFSKPLRVRFIDKDGRERSGSVDDLERNGMEFLQVISGSSLTDAERLLNFMTPEGSVIE